MIIEEIVLIRIRQSAMGPVYYLVMDSFLIKKILPKSSYCGPSSCLGGFLELFDCMRGKDIIPANLSPDDEEGKGIQFGSIGTTCAERIAGGNHPLQILINVSL